MNLGRSRTTSTTPFSMAGPSRRSTSGGSVADAIASSVGADRAETTSSASRVSVGEPLEAVLDEFLKPFRDRGPFAGRHLTPTTQQRASDLLGEEGIAARRLVDAEDGGSRDALTHLVAEHPFDRVDGERPDVDAMHVTIGKRPGDAQGGLRRGRSPERLPSGRPPLP